MFGLPAGGSAPWSSPFCPDQWGSADGFHTCNRGAPAGTTYRPCCAAAFTSSVPGRLWLRHNVTAFGVNAQLMASPLCKWFFSLHVSVGIWTAPCRIRSFHT